jgi:hypothetical protein
MMPKFRLQGTLYTFMDAIVEAKDEDEAIAMYSPRTSNYSPSTANVDWYEVGTDWDFHNDLVALESEGRVDAEYVIASRGDG